MFLKLKNEKAFSLVIVLIILTVGIAALSALAFALIRGFQSSRGLINSGIAYNALEIGVKEFDYQLLDVVLKNKRFRAVVPGFPDPKDLEGKTDLDANGLLLKAKCFYYAWDINDGGEINKDSHDAFNTRWPCDQPSENCYWDDSGDPPDNYNPNNNADVFICGNTNIEDSDDPNNPVAKLGDEIPEEYSDCCEVLANKKLGNNDDCKRNYDESYYDNVLGIIEDINGNGQDYFRRSCYENAWRGWGQDAWRCVNKNAVIRYTTGAREEDQNSNASENDAVDWILDQVWEQASQDETGQNNTCKYIFENKEDASENKILGYDWHDVQVDTNKIAQWRIVSMERSGLSGSMSEEPPGRIKVIFEGKYSGSKVKAEANWYQLSTNTWTQETHLISD